MLHQDQDHHQSDQQSGVALVLCMVFLTALALLGLTASADAILQHQLAANLQETERARQSAQAALESAEKWLLGLDDPPPLHCDAGCEGILVHASGTLPRRPEFETLAWWMETAHRAGFDPVKGEHYASTVSEDLSVPLWMIESLHDTPADGNRLHTWYRILVRGTGRTETAVSVVESTVTRHWALSNNTEAASSDPCSDPGATCGRLAWRELR